MTKWGCVGDDGFERAQAVLGGRPGADAVSRQRRIRRRAIVRAAGLIVVAAAAGLVIGARGGHASAGDDPPLAQVLVGFAVLVAGFVVTIIGFVRLRRAGLIGSRWTSPAAQLTVAQRKALIRQMRGTDPVEPAQLDLTRDIAERVLRSQPIAWMLAGSLVMLIGGEVMSPSAWVAGLMAVSLVTVVVGLVGLNRSVTAARRFLAENPR